MNKAVPEDVSKFLGHSLFPRLYQSGSQRGYFRGIEWQIQDDRHAVINCTLEGNITELRH